MSSIITAAGLGLITALASDEKTLSVTKFVLANVSDASLGDDIPEDIVVPVEDIVYQVAPTKQSTIDSDKVVYSLFMDDDVGDFEFNWMGLIADDNGQEILFAVAYVAAQNKTRSLDGVKQGNNITRNFVVQFSNASDLTNISIPAESWQFDFFSEVEVSLQNAVLAAEAAKQGAEVAEQSAIDELQGVVESINQIEADPENSVTELFLSAKAFDPVLGESSYESIRLRLHAWILNEQVNTMLSTVLSVPSHWNTMKTEFIVCNSTANAGNASMGAETHSWAVGESINQTPSGGGAIFTIPSAPWITASGITSTPQSIDTTKYTTLRVARYGESENDTVEAPIAFIGVRMIKVS